MIVALVGSACAMGASAQTGFDASKRLLEIISAVAGASALLFAGAPPRWQAWSRLARFRNRWRYFNCRSVRSERIAGRVKQLTLLNLGRHVSLG
ncbi:MAG: hypothetical protein ACRESZ_19960 [Methylococcales bacterium]